MADQDTAFSRSGAANAAALTVISAAREAGLLEGAISVSPQLAEDEKLLITRILTALEQRGASELSADEVSSLFTFVFAKAAEAVTALGNHRPFAPELPGMLDGKVPIYADDRLTGYFKTLTFPTDCARNFWAQFASGAGAHDPRLALAEALKWCFRLSCHAAMAQLPDRF